MIRRRRRPPAAPKSLHHTEQPAHPSPPGIRRLLLNATEGDELRVAIVNAEGNLEQMFLELRDKEHQSGNIYKAVVEDIEPSLQAAFVNYGGVKKGFLHVSDVIPPDGGYRGILKKRRGRRKSSEDERIPIQDMLWKGQELLVQLTREAIDQKGAGMTTYITIPGRYLVMMPGVPRLGVSKKIENEAVRDKLKKILTELSPPQELGFIVRTAGESIGFEEIRSDMHFLTRLWNAFAEKAQQVEPPACIYRESDLAIRTIRDLLTPDINEIIVDSQTVFEQIRDFLTLVQPEAVPLLKNYDRPEPLFHTFNLEKQIEETYRRKVMLAGGGHIVIDQTEALVAIDVNTGGYRDRDNQSATIYDTNIRAVREIARQIRLRDLGGLIVLDLIDMDNFEHRRRVENELRRAMEGDKARITMLPISELGVLELTRQRVRNNPRRSLFEPCPCCEGNGMVKTSETVSRELLRRVKALLAREQVAAVRVFMAPLTASRVLDKRKREIIAMEDAFGKRIIIEADPACPESQLKLAPVKENGEIFQING